MIDPAIAAVLAGESRWCGVLGDNLELLRDMPDDCVDAVVTDPPYGLGKSPPLAPLLKAWIETGHYEVTGKGFMGKKWDAFVPSPRTWKEVCRVLKPGGHLLAFAGTRTQHLMALGIQIGGFEVRDMCAYMYGSGFPKSHNVANSIDKTLGHGPRGRAIPTASTRLPSGKYAEEKLTSHDVEAYVARSEQGAPWQGWGTALKPALEPITLARKPLIGTVAANVLKHGTGALNIDACRVPTDWSDRSESWKRSGHSAKPDAEKIAAPPGNGIECNALGRWPANVVHDGSEEVVRTFPDARGQIASSSSSSSRKNQTVYGEMKRGNEDTVCAPRGDTGSAARFFYTTKASRDDRESGLEGFAARSVNDGRTTPIDNPYQRGETERRNTHVSVKPTDLMRWLCRLITPPNGIILDPWMGSGSTGRGAILEGFRFVGYELDPEGHGYVDIARARIAAAEREVFLATRQLSLFSAE